MIKLPGDKVLVKNGELTINPSEALKALEEQAPEVLCEWAEEKYINTIKILTKNEKEIAPLADIPTHRIALIGNRYYVQAEKGPYKSPWIAVLDQEPPKDGRWFIGIDEFEQPDIYDYVNHSWRDLSGKLYPENLPPFVKWMPKPEQEERDGKEQR